MKIGAMEETIWIQISEAPLDLQECYSFVQSGTCGGIAVFVGTVRKLTQGREVKKLEFSAYEPMALKEMRKIASQAMERFQVERMAVHHALGSLGLGEVPVIIAAAAPHREAAFDACRYAIDTLKKTVPIWKKEFFDDGQVWVNAHP